MVVAFAPGNPQKFRTRRGRYGETTSPAQGAIVSRAFNQSDVRFFALGWMDAPKSVFDLILAAHAATLGGALTMDWTSPSGEALRVRFVEDREGFAYDRLTAVSFEIDVLLEEASEHRFPSQIA